MIGVPCSDTGRYSAFADSLANLDKQGATVLFAISTWRHKARNQLVRWMLESESEWLLMVDDDHVFAPDLLTRLLSHDKDIVAALCLRRDEPYSPFCFSEIGEDGRFLALDLAAHESGGLVRVATVGTGAILIRRAVLEHLSEPWFRVTSDSGEDMLFCQDAAAAGFEIHCDLDTCVGHLTTAVVWPARIPEGWKVGFVISDETRILRELPPPEAITA